MPVEPTAEVRRLTGVLEPAVERGRDPDTGGWHWCTKRTLLSVSNAMKRNLASESAADLLAGPGGDPERLVLAYFQRRAYFEVESLRYEAFAATGATVIVGFPGGAGDTGGGVNLVDLSGRDQLVDSWALAVVGGSFAGALVAVDDRGLVEDLATLEESRSFLARWSFRRREAVDACRQLLGPLTARLPARVLARAEAALGRAAAAGTSPAEERLLTALDVLGTALELDPRWQSGQRGGPAAAQLDLLTGLRNRRFLDTYLASRAGESAALVVAMLVDVDDLGALNARLGPEAGDAALVAIASALRQERRRGDVIVRYSDDELLVLAPMNGDEGALERAEGIVATVRALRLPPPYGGERLTVSVGAMVVDPVKIPFERLEDGLHLAKLLGKDSARLVE